MVKFLAKRFALMIVSIFFVSFLSFVIIELPPGDYLTMYITQMEMNGQKVDEAYVEALKVQYGYDKTIPEKYGLWVKNIVTKGDMGRSFLWQAPVKDLLAEKMPYTTVLAVATLFFTFIVAIPIAIYSATHQYSLFDYLGMFISFIGLAIPAFLFALIAMYILTEYFGISVGGVMSQEFVGKPMSIAKFFDMAKYMLLPVIVSGLAGVAGNVRTLRATLLDELNSDYVQTARVKGVSETKLILKYPVRVALNPLLSSIGWLLPQVISGSTVVGVVMSLPTLAPMLLTSLKSQDMYLAGGIVLFLTVLTLVGTFLSDIVLAISDPRIRYD